MTSVTESWNDGRSAPMRDRASHRERTDQLVVHRIAFLENPPATCERLLKLPTTPVRFAVDVGADEAFVCSPPENASNSASGSCASHERVETSPTDRPTSGCVFNHTEASTNDGFTLAIIESTPETLADDTELILCFGKSIQASHATPTGHEQGHYVSLQGASVAWTVGRMGLAAPAERISAIRLSLIEFVFLEQEVRSIESTIADRWGELTDDAALAFDFSAHHVERRVTLGLRFQQLTQLRACWSQLAPRMSPTIVFPPTLASQIGERLRERSRLIERWEILGDQLDVFERVYDQCSQRASDYVHSNKGHILEIIIIILLSFQIVLTVAEFVSSKGSS